MDESTLMSADLAVRAASPALETLAILAAVVFYGRFYIQWIVSEIRKESVVPVAFWYMSSAGSLMLLIFAVAIQSPNGALSHSFNMLVYARNLVHVWREKGAISRTRYWLIHGFVGIIVVSASCLLVYTWWNEFHDTKTTPPDVRRATWFWIAVGTVGQGLFALRFLVQWAATEYQRKSVFPVAFWYLSIAASSFLMAAHFARRDTEWLFLVGLATTLPIYVRNVWLIHRRRAPLGESG